jgi:hypothetical protein
VKVRGKYEMAAENTFIDGWREGREIRMLLWMMEVQMATHN